MAPQHPRPRSISSADLLDGKIQIAFQHHTLGRRDPNRDDRFREAWQQVEALNQATARAYNPPSLVDYEVIKAFRRWSHFPS